MTTSVSEDVESLPKIAFYYPNPYWRDVDWAKNLILFFDGIGMLIPNYMPDAARFDDLAVIEGLKEHGLFHVFHPEDFLDSDATVELTTSLTDLIGSGAFDQLVVESGMRFHELSMSRMGFSAHHELAEMVFEALKERGLARDSEDGVSVPLHPKVREAILVLLAQFLRPNGRKRGLDLLPTTDIPGAVRSLEELLNQPVLPSAGHVISLDLVSVGVDLGPIPIDEVLGFRHEHSEAYREYATNVQDCVRELGLLEVGEQESRLAVRQDELHELAADLRRASRKAWKGPAKFLLSATGAAWRLAKQDYFGAALAGSTALLSLESTPQVETGAFTFLFEAHRKFRY